MSTATAAARVFTTAGTYTTHPEQEAARLAELGTLAAASTETAAQELEK